MLPDRTYAPAMPMNEQAEQALLGALMISNAALDRDEVALLEPGHFANPVHGRIFHAVRALVDRRRLADPVTLRAYFERDGSLTEVGGPAYLARLAASSASIINVEHYAVAIRDAAVRRDILEAVQDIGEMVGTPRPDLATDDLVAECEGRLAAAASPTAASDGMVSLDLALRGALELAEAAYKADGKSTGLTTGLIDLDRATGGLHPTDLLILAGRPAMGKTALATCMALAVVQAEMEAARRDAQITGEPVAPGAVAFFSLEMSRQQLAQRILSLMTAISAERVRAGRIGQIDFQMLVNATGDLDGLPLFIDDTPAASVAQIRHRARRLARIRPLRMIVVDYLQLIAGGGRRTENRTQEVSDITRGLKMLAKEFQVPVLALSQLSRAVEAREDNRPNLADLRESGSIEQDADIVMFVYREEVYTARREPRRTEKQTDVQFTDLSARWLKQMDACRGIAEVIIAKQRHGPTRTVRLHFDGERTRFENLAVDR